MEKEANGNACRVNAMTLPCLDDVRDVVKCVCLPSVHSVPRDFSALHTYTGQSSQ
jgi:hypothetical protein